MKLIGFRIVNCFGFRDSGTLNLDSDHNFIYLLGRNSSGKSSLLNGIKYFERGIAPSEQPNFKNFNDSGEQSGLQATYKLTGSLSDEKFKKDLIKKLSSLLINEGAISSSPKLKTLFDDLLSVYISLIGRLNASNQIVVWKLSDGHYHFMDDDYDSRTKQVSAIIQAATEREGHVNVSGTMRNIPWSWHTFEDLLFEQFPKIYLFNEKFSLREILPERIDSNWKRSDNQFLINFVELLG